MTGPLPELSRGHPGDLLEHLAEVAGAIIPDPLPYGHAGHLGITEQSLGPIDSYLCEIIVEIDSAYMFEQPA